MGDVSTQTWLAVLSLLGGGIAFMFSKQTVDALIAFGNWWVEARARRLEMDAKYRAMIRADEEAKEERRLAQLLNDEELNDKGYKLVIRRQDRRITQLEKIVNESQVEAHKCHEDYAVLKSIYDRLLGEYKELKEDHEQLEKRVNQLEGE